MFYQIFRNRYLEGQVQPPDIPLAKRTRLFVGTKCTYKCKFCYYRKSRHIENDINLPFRQLEFVKNYGMLDVEFTGGEPTLDHFLHDYIYHAKYNLDMRQVCVITNGVRTYDKTYLKSLMDFGLDEILVSLHGADRENHTKMTGVSDSWERACLTIENAKELGLIVRINCVITKDNYDKLPVHAEVVKAYEPTAVNYLPLNVWDDTVTSGVNIPYDKMTPYIKKAISRLEGHVPFISVRFIPFCHMVGYEQYICNWFQQPYDYWDWNNELIDLADGELRCPNDSFGYAELIRHDIYTKYYKCLHCKYLVICDGIEKATVKENINVKPIKGELILDPMLYRRSYCDEQTYNQYIDTHSPKRA